MSKTKTEFKDDLKRQRLDKLAEREKIQQELKEVTQRRAHLNTQLECIDNALLDIDIKHARLNVEKDLTARPKNVTNRLNKQTTKVNNRIKYDLECVRLMLERENRWLRVSELCVMLNERIDMPSYCIEHDQYKFSAALGLHLAKDERFQIKKVGVSKHITYGLVGWEEDDED